MEYKRVFNPIGYACDNCKWVFTRGVVLNHGTWYGEKDGVKGDFWVCPCCETAEEEAKKKTN